ncbi:MAG: response regulator [Patescibacteria group bacterium]
MATILVIEDDGERQHILQAVLLCQGHEIIVSADPGTAWVKMMAASGRPDLIICSSPQRGLAAFLQRKHGEKGYGRIPVIFLLKNEKFNQEETEREPKHNYWFYLAIPFNVQHLICQVDEILAKAACR